MTMNTMISAPATAILLMFCAMAQSQADAMPPAPNSPLSLQADPNFLRFGRSGGVSASLSDKRAASANFLRFGKSVPPAALASDPNFLRFGRQPAPMRVDPSFLRFGRSGVGANNFLRFGRALVDGEAMLVGADDGAFEREYRQANPNFLRFG